MFDREKFANILKKINETYINQTEFATRSDVNRTYLSQYMNLKLSSPPSPKILAGIANASKGITTYDELMSICGYINKVKNTLADSQYFAQIPLFFNLQEFLLYNIDKRIENAPHNYYTSLYTKEQPEDFFAFKAFDNSMIPLLDVGDIAIVHRQNFIEDKQTHLILLDDNILLIRKIIDLKDKLQLLASNTLIDNYLIELSSEEKQERNFTVLGKVIKAENKSAFK